MQASNYMRQLCTRSSAPLVGLNAAMLVLFIPCNSQAALVSGFEAGLYGWTTLGDVSIQNSNIGLEPTQGRNMAFVTTMCDRDKPPIGGCDTSINEHPYSDISSPPAQYARAFLGLPTNDSDFLNVMPAQSSATGLLRGEGGAIKTEFFASQPGLLTFDWNRIGSDADAAYYTVWSDNSVNSFRQNDWILTFDNQNQFPLTPSDVQLCARYYDTDPSQTCDNPAGRDFYNVETGWISQSIQIPKAGSYWFGLGLAEVAEGSSPTILALDNVRYTVPEPDTLSLFGAGLVAMIFTLGRKRSTLLKLTLYLKTPRRAKSV